jgi:hypothetical protein
MSFIQKNWWRDPPDDDRSWMTSYSRGWTRHYIQDVTRITCQTPDCLILERRPSDIPKTHSWAIFWWLCWLPVGMMTAVGVFVISVLPQLNPVVRVLFIGFGTIQMISIGTWFHSLVNAKVRTFILDKAVGELTLVIRSPRQEQISKYSLQDCQGATIVAQLKPHNVAVCRYACRVVLLLDSEQIIRLTGSKLLPGAPTANILADTINEFLGIKPPIEG